MIFVLFLYALFATVFPLCKIAFNNYIEPVFFTGVCLTFAGSVLLLYQYYKDKRAFTWSRNLISPLLMLIVCNIYLTNVCERWGLQYLTAVKTSFIYNLSPFFSAIFSYLLLSERMTRTKWLGLIIGFVGFIPFFIEKSGAEQVSGGFFLCSWAELALITAAIATVIGWIGMRKLVLLGYSPVLGNGISMLVGGLMIIPSSMFLDSWSPSPVRDCPHALIFIVLTSVISYIIAYNMYGWLLHTYSATFLTMAGLTSPLFTALFGWLLLGEQVTWTFFFSMCMVAIGLYIFHSQEVKIAEKHNQSIKEA
jgi:drug/metabolite transporter (DMT)-like permease